MSSITPAGIDFYTPGDIVLSILHHSAAIHRQRSINPAGSSTFLRQRQYAWRYIFLTIPVKNGSIYETYQPILRFRKRNSVVYLWTFTKPNHSMSIKRLCRERLSTLSWWLFSLRKPNDLSCDDDPSAHLPAIDRENQLNYKKEKKHPPTAHSETSIKPARVGIVSIVSRGRS